MTEGAIRTGVTTVEAGLELDGCCIIDPLGRVLIAIGGGESFSGVGFLSVSMNGVSWMTFRRLRVYRKAINPINATKAPPPTAAPAIAPAEVDLDCTPASSVGPAPGDPPNPFED